MSLSKPKSQKRKRKKALTAEEAFHREWERVQKLQKKNENRQAELNKLVENVAPRIETVERKVATSFRLQAEKIFTFLGRKSLPVWCKEELLDWLLDILETLDVHPFIDHMELSPIYQQAQEIFEILEPECPPEYEDFFDHTAHQQTHKKSKAERKTEQHRSAPIDDMFDDLFNDPDLQQAMEDEQEAEDPFEDFFTEWENMFDEAEQEQKDKNSALNKLLRSSNINKMFRKIARILHPDKEQDPAKKELRHQQMSELLKARDDKNITSLFGLYAEHVGTAPLEELGEDLESATQLLKHQAQELREQQQDWDVNSPLEAYIAHHFGEHAGKRPATLERHLAKHNKALQSLVEKIQNSLDNMSSIRAIKPMLEERRRYRALRDVDIPF